MGDQDACAGCAAVEAEPEWTAEDRAAAEREGWDIFECQGSAAGVWQIQSFDDVDDELAAVITANVGRVWGDDPEAWMHVWGVASDLHAKALTFIREMNPAEWEVIETAARDHGVLAANILPANGENR